MARNDKDAVEKILEAYEDVFSDIVNVLLFGGKKVVGEKELTTATPRSIYKADGQNHEQERDTSKYWSKGKIEIALLGLENQTGEDPDMTLRLPGYDGAGYRAQMLRDPKDKKGKRIRRNPRYPVVTLVLYFGLTHWHGSQNLKRNLVIPEGFDPYVNDYHMNLFEIAFLTEEQVNLFESDFRYVADYFVQMRTTSDYRPTPSIIRHVDATLKMMTALTGDDRFEQAIPAVKQNGGNDMGSIVLDRAESRGFYKGKAEGRAEGQINAIITMLSKGISREKLCEVFGREEVEKAEKQAAPAQNTDE